MSCGEVGFGAAKPVGGVVHHPDLEGLLQLLHIVPAVGVADEPIPEKGWVTHDAVAGWPGSENSVGDGDPGQADQRQRVLGFAVAVDHLPVPHPEGDPGDEDRDGLDVDATQVGQRHIGPWLRRQRLPGRGSEVGDALLELVFEGPQFPVGDVEEVAAAAGGVEHHETGEFIEQLARCSRGGDSVDAPLPGSHDGGTDDFQDVGLVGVVRSQLPPALSADHTFHQRAEDGGVDLAPVMLGGLSEEVELRPG